MELKYSLGLDISMEDIKACLCVIDDSQEITIISSYEFTNNKKGISSLISWFNKNRKNKELPHTITLEPTGVYYESCAYTLHNEGFRVSVVVASIVKNYLLSLGNKTKNDTIDAKGIAIMGAQRKLKEWSPMPENILNLRTLTRHNQAIQERLTSTKNQLHSELKSEINNSLVIKQLESSILFDKQQLKDLNEGIINIIKSDNEMRRKFEIVTKITGVGLLTAAIIVSEYGGFEMFSNYKQVISFAGLDVVENQSGRHVGKTKISKKGNSRVRRALFMPAFVCISRQHEELTALFTRILIKNGNKLKMKAYVAVQKKILTYIYYAWKKEIDFSVTKEAKISENQQKEIENKNEILKEKQVFSSPLEFEEFHKKTSEDITKKNSHNKVAAQGRNPVSDHSISPHR